MSKCIECGLLCSRIYHTQNRTKQEKNNLNAWSAYLFHSNDHGLAVLYVPVGRVGENVVSDDLLITGAHNV